MIFTIDLFRIPCESCALLLHGRLIGYGSTRLQSLQVLAGQKLPKTEKSGDTPAAPRKRSGEELLFDTKRRRQVGEVMT